MYSEISPSSTEAQLRVVKFKQRQASDKLRSLQTSTLIHGVHFVDAVCMHENLDLILDQAASPTHFHFQESIQYHQLMETLQADQHRLEDKLTEEKRTEDRKQAEERRAQETADSFFACEI